MKPYSVSRISLLAAAVAILCIAHGCAGVMVSRGLTPKRSDKAREESFAKNRAVWEHLVPGITAWGDSLVASGAMRDTFIVRSGVRLHASYVPYGESCGISRRTAVVVHGYRSSPYNVMAWARMYRDSLGYNVLMPTLRYHGYSEGASIQMGWLDRLDVLEWARVAHELFSDTLQVMQGVSMGAATIMMLSGEDIPDYIRGFVEDCGYTSVWNEVNYALDHYLGMKWRPTAYVAERKVSRRYGWNFHEASSVAALSSCEVPFLFIHGSNDELVPPEMAQFNYNAKVRGYRELWIAPGSKHARSIADHGAEYTARVRKFLQEHVQ